jgi:hypothetical protein
MAGRDAYLALHGRYCIRKVTRKDRFVVQYLTGNAVCIGSYLEAGARGSVSASNWVKEVRLQSRSGRASQGSVHGELKKETK